MVITRLSQRFHDSISVAMMFEFLKTKTFDIDSMFSIIGEPYDMDPTESSGQPVEAATGLELDENVRLGFTLQ